MERFICANCGWIFMDESMSPPCPKCGKRMTQGVKTLIINQYLTMDESNMVNKILKIVF